MEPNTSFLNVDLQIKSGDDLVPLLVSFGSKVGKLYQGKVGRWYWLRVDLARPAKTPKEAIRRFCRLIKSLPSGPRKLWNGSAIREFDIGIQSGRNPFSAEWVLDAATVEQMASVGAQVEFTVYSPAVSVDKVTAHAAQPGAAGRRAARKNDARTRHGSRAARG
jgi:hypothetical protein